MQCNESIILQSNISITHWGRVTHICVRKLTIIRSDNGLPPGRHHAIIWTNAGLLLIGPLRTNFSEILIEIHTFSFRKMHLKMSSGKWRPQCVNESTDSMQSHLTWSPALAFITDSTISSALWSLNWAHYMCHWASSTGLTAVSKFKPRLPAQWAVGTYRKGPSRMEKVTSIMNWPTRNTSQIRN